MAGRPFLPKKSVDPKSRPSKPKAKAKAKAKVEKDSPPKKRRGGK